MGRSFIERLELFYYCDDEVIGDSHLTNSSSDGDYELPNVEQENNWKDVEGLFMVTRSGRTATNWRALEYGFY